MQKMEKNITDIIIIYKLNIFHDDGWPNKPCKNKCINNKLCIFYSYLNFFGNYILNIYFIFQE